MTTTVHASATGHPAPRPAAASPRLQTHHRVPAVADVVVGFVGTARGVVHLRSYVAREGHATVPNGFVTDDGFNLGYWVGHRRQDRQAGRLTAVMIAELDALGMVWGSSRDDGYRIGMAHLRAYIAREGHANVPRSCVTEDGFRLGYWVNSRRQDRRVGRLSTARIAELSALGMVWGSSHAANYRIGVDHLRDYTAATGHTSVSNHYVTDGGFNLGEWVVRRRYERRVGALSAVRVAELTGLGMVWDAHDAGYRAGLGYLRVFVTREGHAVVPQSYASDEGFPLGRWLHHRRQDYKVGRLSAARVAEMDDLGMVWKVRAS